MKRVQCIVKSEHDMMKTKHLITRKTHHIIRCVYRIMDTTSWKVHMTVWILTHNKYCALRNEKRVYNEKRASDNEKYEMSK